MAAPAPTDIAWRIADDARVVAGGETRTPWWQAPAASHALAPGESLQLALPARRVLRWQAGAEVTPLPVVRVADDGNLFREAAGLAGPGFRWLAPATRERRIVLANTGARPLAVRVWIGEPVDPATPPARIAQRPAAGGAAVRWRALPSRDIGHGARARPGEPLRYTLEGPTRVEIESVQDAPDPGARPAWLLASRMDAEPARPWHLFAPVDTREVHDVPSRTVSLPRSVFLDIPAGSHALSIDAGPDVTVRVHAGGGLLFDANAERLYPRAADARQRQQDLQDAREAMAAGDPAAAAPLWRAMEPDASVLASRVRAWRDVEPVAGDAVAFAWYTPAADDARTGTGASAGRDPIRLLRAAPGQAVQFRAPDASRVLQVVAAGEPGTRIDVTYGDRHEVLWLAGDAATVDGRALLDASAGDDMLVVQADRAVLVSLRAAQAREDALIPRPPVTAPRDPVQALREPRHAPDWLLPLAERLAARMPPDAARDGNPACAAQVSGLPAEWRDRASDAVASGDPETAARLLARARTLCTGGAEASDRLAALLRDAGEWSAWESLRLADARGPGGARAVSELRVEYRRQEDWTALETLGAYRLAAGDAGALALVGEALLQQGQGTLVAATCQWMAANDIRADHELVVHACNEAGAGRAATPWAPLVADDGEAAGLRTLEYLPTWQRASRYLSTPAQPLVLRLQGAQSLRVEVRRRVPAGQAAMPPAWFTIELDDVARLVPLPAAVPASDWRVAGESDGVGQAERVVLRVPPGARTLRIHGGEPLLVGVSAADPAWPRADGTTTASDFLATPSLGEADIAEPPATGRDGDGTHALLRLAWWSEHSRGADARAYRARLLAAAQAQAGNRDAAGLVARATWQQAWQRETRVVDSAGLRYVENAPDGSPSLRLRRALLDLPADDAFARHGTWVTPDSAPGVLADGRAWQKIRITARNTPLPGTFTASPAALAVTVDDHAAAQLLLAPGSTPEAIVPLAPGMHRVVLRLAAPSANPFVQARIEGFDGRRWEPISLQPDRSFLVSRADAPVRVAVDAAEWLRVDELAQGRLRTRYVFQPAPGTVTLAPEAGGERVLRVYALREDLSPRPASTPATPAPRPSLARTRALGTLAGLEAPVSWEITGESAALPESIHADTVYLAGERRTDVDSGARDSGHTIGLGLLHRQRLAPDGLWWRSDAFARDLPGADRGLGTVQTLEWHPADRPWYAQLEGEAHALLASAGNDEYSAQLTARWRQEHAIDRAFQHRVGADLFVRALSADAARGATITDSDVWSSWKDEHRHGLRVSERWRWQPAEDALLQLEYGLNSNEAGDRLLDSGWIAPGARLWWRGISFEAGYRWQQWQADDDRTRGFEREWIDVAATWHAWRPRGGWFVETAWRQELRRDENSLRVGAGWTWGAGPRAWLPSELPFRSLHTRAADVAATRDRLTLDADHAGR